MNGEVRRDFDINPYSFALNTARTVDPEQRYVRNYTSFNIFDELDRNYIDLNVTDLKFQGELSFKPIMKDDQSLEFNILGSMRVATTEQNHYVLDNSNQAMAYRAGIDPDNAIIRSSNSYLYTDPDVENALPETILDKGGMLFYNKHNNKTFLFRATGQYTKQFDNGNHYLGRFGGMEANRFDRFSELMHGASFMPTVTCLSPTTSSSSRFRRRTVAITASVSTTAVTWLTLPCSTTWS